MGLQDKIVASISAINPITKEYSYGDVICPATTMEIENAFQKARVQKGGEYFVEIISSPKIPKLGEVYIDGGINIVELNLLAERVNLLSDEQLTVFNAMFENSIDDNDMMAPSLEELINMTYGLDKMVPIHGITTDEELGEFVIDNNLSEALQTASDDVLEYVSKELVGRKFREMENGVFYNGAYIPLGTYEKQSVYTSPAKEQLEIKNDFAFALKIAEAPVNDSNETEHSAEWMCLPIDKAEANNIAKDHNEVCIEDCVYYKFISAFPSIDEEVFDDMLKFDDLNEIAARYIRLDAANRIKFKAIVEKVEPQTLNEVLEIAENLNRYEHSYYVVDESQFGKEYLSKNLPTNFAMDVFANVELKYVGDRILERIGADINDYGAVSDIDRGLYDTVISCEFEQEEESEDEIQAQDEDIPKIDSAEMMFSAGRSRRISIIAIIQSLAQLEKNYGKEGSSIIVDNCQLTVFGGFAPNSETAEVMSKNLGEQTILSGSITQSKNDGSKSLQMMSRALMTVDELKTLPKFHFIIAKTGVHPMKTKLDLFFNWGIELNDEYENANSEVRQVYYADKDSLMSEIQSREGIIIPEEVEEIRTDKATRTNSSGGTVMTPAPAEAAHRPIRKNMRVANHEQQHNETN